MGQGQGEGHDECRGFGDLSSQERNEGSHAPQFGFVLSCPFQSSRRHGTAKVSKGERQYTSSKPFYVTYICLSLTTPSCWSPAIHLPSNADALHRKLASHRATAPPQSSKSQFKSQQANTTGCKVVYEGQMGHHEPLLRNEITAL